MSRRNKRGRQPSSATGPPPPPTTNNRQAGPQMNELDKRARLLDLVYNITSLRRDWIRSTLDPRRDINKECGYPESSEITVANLQDMYDREAIAARVVECLPMESWQVQPGVYETEDSEEATLFEQTWDAFCQSVRGEQSYYQDEEGNPVWEYLRRLDVQSRIGHYGVLLFGLDDGKDLSEPADFVKLPPRKPRTEKELPVWAPGAAEPEKAPDGFASIFDQFPDGPDSGASGGAGGGGTLTRPSNLMPTVDPFANPGGVESQYGRDLLPGAPPATGPEATPTPAPGGFSSGTWTPARRVLYLRIFPESQAFVAQMEEDSRSPRYGQPNMYRLTFNDPRLTQESGVALAATTRNVHWTRVLHVPADLEANEVFGKPAQQPVWNRLLDLRKIYSADGEGYWKAVIAQVFFETQPNTLDGETQVDVDSLKNTMEDMENGLQRWALLRGLSAKTVPPQINDPRGHIEVHLEAICIKIGCPIRVFKGSERGELASAQDDEKWNDVLRDRQRMHVTPRVIVPFVDRLIQFGALPPPVGFSVAWPDLESVSDSQKATTAFTWTQALQAYVVSGASEVMTFLDYLVRIWKMDDEEAVAIVEAAEEAAAEAQAEQAAQAAAQLPAPPDGQPTAPNGQPAGVNGQPTSAAAVGVPQL